MLYVILHAAAGWQPNTIRGHATPSRAALRVPNGVVAELQVLMQRFLPTLPCINPQTAAEKLKCVDGGTLVSPVWLLPTLAEPDRGLLALADRGKQLQWDGDMQQPSLAVLGQCFSGTFHASEFGAAAESLAALVGDTPRLVTSLGQTLSDGEPQLLVATAGGSVLWIGDKDRGDAGLGLGLDGERAKKRAAPVTPLLSQCGDVRGLCINEGARRMYLSLADGTLAVADLDLLESGTCSPLRQLGTSDTGGGPLTCDCVGNLYLCTPEGVQVFDEEGEPFLQVSTPQPATGCCFGGSGLSNLFITAGDSLWSMECNVQGAMPASELLLKQMEKLGEGQRHDGW